MSEPPVTTTAFRSPAAKANAPLPGPLGAISKVVWGVLFAVGAVGLVALFLTTVTEVVLRTFGGSSIPGGTDLVSKWWMVMTVFAGIAIAQHAEGRIQIDFVIDALPIRWRIVVDTIVLVFVALVGLAFTWLTLQEALHQMSVGEYAPIGNRPIWPFRFALPIGFFAFSFACVLSIVHLYRVGYPDPAAKLENPIEVSGSAV